MEKTQIESARDGWSGRRCSSITREKYQLATRVNKSRCSELVVGTSAKVKWRRENSINMEVETDKEEFGTVFSKPQQTSDPGVTLLYHYPRIQKSDVIRFLEPPAGQIFQPQYQDQLPPEDKGVINPPSIDVQPLVQAMSGREVSPGNEGYVLHIDNAQLIVKDELLEMCPPPCVTIKHRPNTSEETLPATSTANT